jgi:hypothetical protein
VAHHVNRNRGDPVLGHLGRDEKGVVFIAGVTVAEYRHWPSALWLGARGQEEIEVNVIRHRRDRRASQRPARRNILSGMNLVVWRGILAEREFSHRTGNHLERAE